MTPTTREDEKVINQKNNDNFMNKKSNISISFERNHLKDLKDEKNDNIIEDNPQDFPFENKNKNLYNNNNHKRYKTPYNNLMVFYFRKNKNIIKENIYFEIIIINN